ncbi:hypothetical protein OIU78_016315 [Salix suchowensis]|nr:hypothetical protein OIU78_016315 [Salix suchowensis]
MATALTTGFGTAAIDEPGSETFFLGVFSLLISARAYVSVWFPLAWPGLELLHLGSPLLCRRLFSLAGLSPFSRASLLILDRTHQGLSFSHVAGWLLSGLLARKVSAASQPFSSFFFD